MRNKHSGASLTEFIVAAPMVMLVGMATVQAALIYHGKTTLNYATFEAARTGAVNHAQVTLMVKELGQRLAPVQGGNGSLEAAALAMAKSIVEAERPDVTRLEILNPTLEAFDDWGIHSQTTHHRVIPNNHLRHKDHEIGQASGLSVRDANLLKIKVTYGLDLKVPVVGRLFALAMAEIDTENAHFYSQKKFPLTAVATVRMQSEVWEQEILAARESSQPPGEVDTGVDEEGDGQQPPTGDTPNELPSDLSDSECEGGEYGLGSVSELINTSDYVNNQCPVENPAFGAPISGGMGSGSGATVCN
ncbi:MAG: hypothetical protein ACI8UP_001810 [Porticoccaceae bacterium]|jgi:hypothetical protein